MVDSADIYHQAPLDGVVSQHLTTMRGFKVGVSLIGGSCCMFLSIVVLRSVSMSSTQTLRSASAADPANLVAFAPSSRLPQISKGASPVLPNEMSNLLGGPSPWKNLAIKAIQLNNQHNGMRDVAMKVTSNDEIKNEAEKMDEETKKDVAELSESVLEKARNMAGVTAPMGFWDPLGFVSPKMSEGKLLFYREVELKHGRICMLASLGILVGENFHPLFGGDIDVPAYRAFQETPLQTFWLAVVAAIAIPEMYSVPTFASPSDGKWWMIKDGREPGDLNFDPLGL
jgi:hypothetical protein